MCFVSKLTFIVPSKKGSSNGDSNDNICVSCKPVIFNTSVLESQFTLIFKL